MTVRYVEEKKWEKLKQYPATHATPVATLHLIKKLRASLTDILACGDPDNAGIDDSALASAHTTPRSEIP